NGASLHLIPYKDAADAVLLARHIRQHELTVAFITTALFNAFVDVELAALQGLRKLLFGGELVSTHHVKKALAVLGPDKIVHVYGPTETTVYATYHPVATCKGNTLPIGQALSNTQVYIVDEQGQIAGTNVLGEIWIGGDGVANGYLNRPKLTAEKFVDNPFGKGRIYKTGDLARILPDGNIEFIGRQDTQIKMRGYRIELGEIESNLKASDQVQQAVVIAQEDASGTQQLVAYIVPQGDFDQEAIEQSLKNKLPTYMIPAIMVALETLPLTANGKVDKKALPQANVTDRSTTEFVAPRTETEIKIANIWKDLLHLESVGIHHDFFDLGGHSLLATRVVSEIRDQFNVELAIRDLFQATTVAQLAQLVEAQEQQSALPKLVVQERPQRIPLSYAQERLWFIDQLEGSLHYHISRIIKIDGEFNTLAFEKALQAIVNRHELLRTVIKEDQGIAYQEVLPSNQWSMQWDLEHDQLSVEQVTALVDKIITRPFDLSQEHPLRVEVIKVSKDEHIMVMIMHHIASDAWSFGVFLDEFNALYSAYEKGEELSLDPLPIQYADFAIWQRKYHDGVLLDQQLDYWQQQLQNNTPLSIPTDFPRPALQSFRGANSGIFVNKELTDQLNALASQQEVTPFMLLLTAFKTLLYRYSGQGDLSVGTPIAGRTVKEVESLIGFFVNTLVIRSQVEATTPFDQYLEIIKQTTLDAFANQMAPFEKIVETLGVERDPSRSPIFQVMFAYQNAPTASGDQQEASSLKVSYTDTTTVIQAQRDISISIEETPDGLLIGANYCADLYLPATMERMMEHYLYLLQAIVAAPKQPIGQLNMLSEQEQQTLLGFNHLTTDYPKEQTIIELFEEQVRLHQDQTALVFEEQSWTYQELDQASDQLAMRLQRDFNVQPGDFVGLLVERSPWMIIGIMGILKVGAAYVPISIDHPLERKQFIVSDTQIRVLLTTNFAQAHCTELAVDTWAMDQQEQTPKSDTPVELPVFDSQTPAYMIYTSGTTGLPKGTLVSHQNLINLIRADENLVYQSTDRVLQWPSYTFDISAYDIFGALLNGAALYLIGENVYNDPALLAQLIQAQQISATSLATAFFNTLVDHDVMIFKGMRRVLMGGEKASLSHTRKFVEAIGPNVLINAYGPTEATILTAYYPVQSVNFDRLPIGSPIANVNMYIVNAFEQLAGIGVIGELWIGGDAVSLGYHQRPELTAEKFVSDPFHPAADARVYKTGDLARYLPDGNIEFIGRIDTQVKVRGYRIELSEIEYAIQEHNSVRQSIVLAKEDTNGLAQIIAYIVGTADFDQATLQQAIQSKLPAYMLPAAYVRIDEVPLNVQGKVDQARLPKPDFLEGSQVAYVAARNELEQQIIDIWSDLLEVDQIGVHHSFFELGGHSLLATRAIAQIKSLRAVELNVRDLFQHPTVAQLAEFVERQSGIQQIPELTPQERGAMIPLSFAQERLWFVHQLSGSQQYHTPNILTLRPDTDPVLLMQAFKEVVQRHEVLRTLIREQNGQAYQIVTSAEDWQVTFMEQTPFQNEEEQQTHFEQFVSEAFDFSQEYPLRVQLIQVGDEGYILAMVVHHIASDGWSASILIDEVWNIYQALSNGKQANLPLLDVQYADYAIWQRKYYGEATIQQQLDYWKIQLNELTTLELPTDFPRPAVQSIRGANLAVQLSPTTTQQLLALAQSCQVTPFMLVMAACKVLLYRYSNQQDICIGTPIAGRTTKATEQLIGCFINTLAIRSQVDSDMTFEQLLAQVKQTTLDAFANQLVPFEQIVDALGTERDMSRSPIYQVSLSYQNTPDAEGMPGGEEAPEGTTGMTLPVTTQRDLSIFAKEFPDGLVLTMNYCVDLFAAHTVEQMLKHLQMILQSIVESPKASVAALGMIDREERTLLLQEWNDTAFDYPDDQSIAHLFEQQVEQTPEQTALVFGTKLWSYQELNTQANRLAHYLQQQHQVGQGDFVAMLVPRSEWAIVAILGILKTGAAYVPIDLKYPQERKQHILNDTQAKVVLTLSDQLAEVMELDATLCTLDMELSAFEQEGSASNPDFAQQGGQHLAYAMYTSGSTGLPKGVLIPHRAIARLIFSADFAFLGQETRMYQYAPLAFDASTFEIWGSLLKGGTLIVPDDELKTVKAIAEDLQQYSVNTLWLTAGLFHHVVENHLALFDGLDYLLSGGDSLRVPAIQKVRAAYPELVFINGYGPTESTTFATIHRLDAGENPAPNLNLIGRPISNTQIYILHPDSQVLTPRGIAGEICIGGDGLANAYLNLPQLTADKFIDHPFMAGQRLYRTGDLGKFLPDGKIAFMGRIDHQVKIRGYRIELTEIEHILMQHEGIKQAIVKTVEDANGSKFLAAYISKAVDVEMAVIQDQLKQQVPDYMLPTIWLEVEVFPLNNNGKVDRDLLPLPDLSELSTQEYVAPRNEIETTLADIWAALLKQERVGIYDNFFELGGHSLLAMQAISNMQEAFNVSINVGDLFRNPTVEMMSQVIEEQASQPIERIQPKDDADNIDRIEIEDDF
ncbi:MAG: amino acid adenylation domain-containing protein, partial [Bacteroidota bacterium]